MMTHHSHISCPRISPDQSTRWVVDQWGGNISVLGGVPFLFQILTFFQLGIGFPGMFRYVRYVSPQLTMSAGRTPARVSSTSKHGLSTKHREAILPHPVRCGNLRCFSSMFQIRCREIYGPNGRCYIPCLPQPHRWLHLVERLHVLHQRSPHAIGASALALLCLPR